MSTLLRVVNQQLINRSILLDKIDRSQSTFQGYAQKAKQKIYVPYVNPLDTAVKGYVDLVPTDEVLLQATGKGVIAKLASTGYVTTTAFNSTLTATPVISGVVKGGADSTITGTTFLSLSPDITYVIITNPTGTSQIIPQSAYTSHIATEIVIDDAAVTIGTPGAGWSFKVKANSKSSNVFTL